MKPANDPFAPFRSCPRKRVKVFGDSNSPNGNTVDGWNPVPVDNLVVEICWNHIIYKGFSTIQTVGNGLGISEPTNKPKDFSRSTSLVEGVGGSKPFLATFHCPNVGRVAWKNHGDPWVVELWMNMDVFLKGVVWRILKKKWSWCFVYFCRFRMILDLT